MSARDKRRKLLTGVAVVGATSPIWVKPTITSVVLPSHAQTTNPISSTTTLGPTINATTTRNPAIDILIEVIIPDILGLKGKK